MAFRVPHISSRLNTAKPGGLLRYRKEDAAKPLSQRLSEQADDMERQAEHFRGCSFVGEWSGSHYLRQASLLKQAAVVAKQAEMAEKKPKSAQRKKTASQEVGEGP